MIFVDYYTNQNVSPNMHTFLTEFSRHTRWCVAYSDVASLYLLTLNSFGQIPLALKNTI